MPSTEKDATGSTALQRAGAAIRAMARRGTAASTPSFISPNETDGSTTHSSAAQQSQPQSQSKPQRRTPLQRDLLLGGLGGWAAGSSLGGVRGIYAARAAGEATSSVALKHIARSTAFHGVACAASLAFFIATVPAACRAAMLGSDALFTAAVLDAAGRSHLSLPRLERRLARLETAMRVGSSPSSSRSSSPMQGAHDSDGDALAATAPSVQRRRGGALASLYAMLTEGSTAAYDAPSETSVWKRLWLPPWGSTKTTKESARYDDDAAEDSALAPWAELCGGGVAAAAVAMAVRPFLRRLAVAATAMTPHGYYGGSIGSRAAATGGTPAVAYAALSTARMPLAVGGAAIACAAAYGAGRAAFPALAALNVAERDRVASFRAEHGGRTFAVVAHPSDKHSREKKLPSPTEHSSDEDDGRR